MNENEWRVTYPADDGGVHRFGRTWSTSNQTRSTLTPRQCLMLYLRYAWHWHRDAGYTEPCPYDLE
eukprot:277297-Amphidinium_carterae.1